jgi:nitroreductase
MTNKILESIMTLRSVHDEFNDKEISDELMDTIINCSTKAASASNIQRYSMILLDNSDLIYEITGKRTAKKAIIYCIDYNRIINTAKFMNLDYIPGVDNWYDIISGIFDVSSLAQTAVIAANALGIDSLITNGVLRQNQKSVKQKLNLPSKYCIPIMAVLFGYYEKPKSEVKNRLSPELLVHKNTYNCLEKEQYEKIIREYDEIYPQYIDESHPHYLTWFYNKWCKPLDENLKNDLKQIMLEAGFKIE